MLRRSVCIQVEERPASGLDSREELVLPQLMLHWIPLARPSGPSKTARQSAGQFQLSHGKVNGIPTKLILTPAEDPGLAKHSLLFLDEVEDPSA